MMGERRQGANCVEDFRYHPVRRVRVVLRYVFADVVEVDIRFRVERISVPV